MTPRVGQVRPAANPTAMSEIRSGGGEAERPASPIDSVAPRLVVQQVGAATVYFRVGAGPLPVANEPEFRAVAAIDSNVFDEAARVVSESVKVMGERIRGVAKALQPSKLEVEISFGFEVKGKATIVPVLLTGESTASAGLKVTATWEGEAPVR